MTHDEGENTRNLLDAIEEDWDASRPRAPAPALSAPNLDELDASWEDDDDEEEEENEDDDLELPDERLDPAAYAAAQKERQERLALKRQRRREKQEAKRAKQKERATAARQKQKGKKPRATAPKEAAPKRARPKATSPRATAQAAPERGAIARTHATPEARAAEVPTSIFTRTNVIMLGVALAVVVTAAIFAAVMAR